MLFALSMLSISCSKLSKATSLSSSEMSADWIAAIDSRIRSASLGPPMSTLRASAFRLVVRGAGGGEVGEVVEVFSRLHFRRLFMPGSMIY